VFGTHHSSKVDLRAPTLVVLAACLVSLLAVPSSAHAQRQVGIPFECEDGYVLDSAEPGGSLRLDVGEIPTSSKTVIQAAPSQRFTVVDAEGRTVSRERLRPGAKVAVQGERIGGRFVVHSLQILEDPTGEKVKLTGLYERLDGDRATIDGQEVVLGDGVTVEGAEAWKGLTFAGFHDMMLSSWVEIQGVRRADGTVVARAASTWPNLFSDADRELLDSLQQKLTVPAARQNLAGGQVSIGGAQFQLVENLDLQTYVNRVGTRLIPRYLREMPPEDPAKVTFRFYVIDDPSFNAFAYQDGSVFVHTGLLELVENEAQLAAVLGHEIAHVTYEHGSRRYTQRKKIKTGKKVAKTAGKLLGKLGKVNPFKKKKKVLGREVDLEEAIDFGTGVLSNTYGRKMESQADRVGLFYMVEAGYDPREAPKIWGKLVELAGDPNKLEKMKAKVENFLFSTHPADATRLRKLNHLLALHYHDVDFQEARVGREKHRTLLAATSGPALSGSP